MQCSAAQHSAVQRNAVQCTVQRRVTAVQTLNCANLQHLSLTYIIIRFPQITLLYLQLGICDWSVPWNVETGRFSPLCAGQFPPRGTCFVTEKYHCMGVLNSSQPLNLHENSKLAKNKLERCWKCPGTQSPVCVLLKIWERCTNQSVWGASSLKFCVWVDLHGFSKLIGCIASHIITDLSPFKVPMKWKMICAYLKSL